MKKTRKKEDKFCLIPVIYCLFVIGIVLLLVYVGIAIEKPVGGKTDEHGCFLTAGYSWCESKQKCLRIWEEECPTEFKMTLEEAIAIAQNSECVEEGNLTENYMHNNNTKTWWIDLDIEKHGCSPACVVSEETMTAEINWRCTGLLPK